MSVPFALGPNEGILMLEDECCVDGEVYLTHERVVAVSRTLFGNVGRITEVPLSEVKVLDGEAQLFVKKDSGALTVCLLDGTTVDFPFTTDTMARAWADAISLRTAGCRKYPEGQLIPESATVHQKRQTYDILEVLHGVLASFLEALPGALARIFEVLLAAFKVLLSWVPYIILALALLLLALLA